MFEKKTKKNKTKQIKTIVKNSRRENQSHQNQRKNNSKNIELFIKLKCQYRSSFYLLSFN